MGGISRDVAIMQDDRQSSSSGSRMLAVLGPTNTGKTHLAMERMLGHGTGMIGFPLRLLARENYERAIRIKGERFVALITGEEKIIPPDARWFLCTVEAMPLDRRVSFLGVDEIQMAADPDRGHIFTDRLLHARGDVETMFMGADTIRPLIRRLVPNCEFISRPRFSSLAYTGPQKISRLPPRTAVVAFSIADIYAIAELVRRQRGGAALVLGALSPRTRNAQVAMYQAGEVDYLVATDAIGMGLNMNVDHVAFAATRKFDGRAPRTLTPSELAQIAGRAGRYTKNGTFGVTAEISRLDEETVERIENHRFDALTTLLWRNSELRFTSLAALRASLARPPDRPGLARAREADDELALAHLARDEDIATLASAPERVRLLWDVCQIPDFGKVSDGHARLLMQIYRYLAGADGDRRGRLPTDWVAHHVDRINRTDGDIEALMQRIANIRTWTYIAQRGEWLDHPDAWQQRTRVIEDKLSDVLHERLIQRFVDRRTTSLVNRMKERRDLDAAVSVSGEVLVEGHFVGMLAGFRFEADEGVVARASDAGRTIAAAAQRALKQEILRRVSRLEGDDDDAFTIASDGMITWQGTAVARLVAGGDILKPGIEPLPSELLTSAARDRIRRHLAAWLAAELRGRLKPLYLAENAAVSAPARGLLFQIGEALGGLPRRKVASQLTALDDRDRRMLRRLDLRIGRNSVYFPSLLKPGPISLRGLLWTTHHRQPPMPLQAAGRTSIVAAPGWPPGFIDAVGFRSLGPRLVRIDIVERLLATAERLAGGGPFHPSAEIATLLGCGLAEVAPVLAGLGYRVETGESGALIHAPARRRSSRNSTAKRKDGVAEDHSPFASLRTLTLRR